MTEIPSPGQGGHHLAPDGLAKVGGKIEIADRVMWPGWLRPALLVEFKEKELQLDACSEAEPHVARLPVMPPAAPSVDRQGKGLPGGYVPGRSVAQRALPNYPRGSVAKVLLSGIRRNSLSTEARATLKARSRQTALPARALPRCAPPGMMMLLTPPEISTKPQIDIVQAFLPEDLDDLAAVRHVPPFTFHSGNHSV